MMTPHYAVIDYFKPLPFRGGAFTGSFLHSPLIRHPTLGPAGRPPATARQRTIVRPASGSTCDRPYGNAPLHSMPGPIYRRQRCADGRCNARRGPPAHR